MPDFGVTDEGYTAPRSADFLTLIRDGFLAKVLELTDETITVDWEADTFLGAITAVMADQLGSISEATQSIYDAVDVNNATGLTLDNLCLIVNVTREPATFSQVTQTLTGTAGTIIVEGKIVEGGGTDGRARWRTTEDATIGGGGTVDVIIQAEEAGEVIALAGEIDQIVTPVDGWASTTNATAATPGVPRESDSALRKRRQQSLQVAGSRSLNALRGNILAIDSVTAAIVVDNDTAATAVVEGLTLVAHSIGVVVYPATLTTEQRQEVAQAIYNHLSAGINTNGTDVVATVTDVSGFGHLIRYDFATTFTVNVATTVVLGTGFELADVEEPIQELIDDLFLAFNVGDAARVLAILALIATVDGVTGASVLLNGFAVDIDPNATVLLVLGTNTVVV